MELTAQEIQKASLRVTLPQMEMFQKLILENHLAKGQLVITGVGKSGKIAQKIASTFSSLGRPSCFLHPTEALHGDLGLVTPNDVLILISKSGQTREILDLLPHLPIPQEKRIGLLGNGISPLAKMCGLIFDCSVTRESCINNLAPTTSTSVALAVADALAVSFEKFTSISNEDFAKFHPGGLLGKSLSRKVSDLMCKLDQCARVNPLQPFRQVMVAMTEFNLGGCAVVSSDNTLLGLIVEGDIRRVLTKHQNPLELPAEKLMNSGPVTIDLNASGAQALELMEGKERKLQLLPVVDQFKKFHGFLRLHDILSPIS